MAYIIIGKYMVDLNCKKVLFYSSMDEAFFFDWISRIPAVIKVEKTSDEIHLHVRSVRISYENLDKLVSLFQRYKIKRRQLGVFLNDRNKHWLQRLIK